MSKGSKGCTTYCSTYVRIWFCSFSKQRSEVVTRDMICHTLRKASWSRSGFKRDGEEWHSLKGSLVSPANRADWHRTEARLTSFCRQRNEFSGVSMELIDGCWIERQRGRGNKTRRWLTGSGFVFQSRLLKAGFWRLITMPFFIYLWDLHLERCVERDLSKKFRLHS